MARARKAVDTSTYSGRLAVRMRTLRERAGLSVEDVCEALGVTIKTYYSWESNTTGVDINRLPSFADTVGLKSTRTVFPEK